MRRCVGCGRHAPKATLSRLASSDGVAVLDRAQALPGRGAYVCGAPCAQRALSRGALARAFRHQVTVNPDFVESEFRG